jgi:hypothetical protein
MAERLWFPYAPDQQFGVRAAADSEALDRLIALLESRQPDPPRAGNKAPLAGPEGSASSGMAPAPASWRSVAEWLAGVDGPVPGAPGSPPSTTASVLDASPWVRTDG